MRRINPFKMFQGAFVPNAIMRVDDLSPSAKLALGRLFQYAGVDGHCYPKVETLSQEIGLSESRTYKVLKELKDYGLIYVKSASGKERLMHKPNRYYFLDHAVYQSVDQGESAVVENDMPGLAGNDRSGIAENSQCKDWSKTATPTEENHLRESTINLGSEKNSDGGLEKKKKFHGSDEDHALAHQIYEAVLVVNATVKVPNWDRWANDIRLMRVQDGRTHDDMWRVFLFANRDSFWSHNILSPGSLRRSYSKLAPRAGLVKSQVRGVVADVVTAGKGMTCGECEFAGQGKKICGGHDALPEHEACELFRAALERA